MGIKEDLDRLYDVSDEEIDKIILEQKIDEEEIKLDILKEMIKYKSFENYVKDHEKDFDMMEITDDFKMIIIPREKYPNISLDMIKKVGVVADHYGIFIYVDKLDKKTFHIKRDDFVETEIDNIRLVRRDCMEKNKGMFDVEIGDCVKIRFIENESKGGEYMWVNVTEVSGDKLCGILNNDPAVVKNVKCGDEVIFDKGEVCDKMRCDDE